MVRFFLEKVKTISLGELRKGEAIVYRGLVGTCLQI